MDFQYVICSQAVLLRIKAGQILKNSYSSFLLNSILLVNTMLKQKAMADTSGQGVLNLFIRDDSSSVRFYSTPDHGNHNHQPDTDMEFKVIHKRMYI